MCAEFKFTFYPPKALGLKRMLLAAKTTNFIFMVVQTPRALSQPTAEQTTATAGIDLGKFHAVSSPAHRSSSQANSIQSSSIPSGQLQDVQQQQVHTVTSRVQQLYAADLQVDTLHLLNIKMDALLQSIDNLMQVLSTRNEDGLELEDFGLPVDTRNTMTAVEDQLRDKTK
jgi:hypothetical protein